MPTTFTPDLHLYIDIPRVIFRARLNMPGTITYPVTTLTFDTVILGAYTDIVADMTLILGSALGLDDLGRVRVQNLATSTTIPVGRVSKGSHDGELNIADNAYVEVWEDYRVWSRLPFIDANGNSYKDANVAVGTHTTTPPPVSNCGPGVADYVNSISRLLTVQFPMGGVNDSLAVADGATITSYAWDLKGGTVVVGTLSSAVLTATFPPGKYWVTQTVTDSNGKSHTSRCVVLALDPDHDVAIRNFQVESHRIEMRGQSIAFRLLEDTPRTTYPDGCLVIFWNGTMLNPGDRSNLKFYGWHQSDSFGIRATDKGLIRDTVLNCVDVAGRLAALPGFPQALERVTPATTWEHMPTLDMRKCLHYLAFWHSTALSLADFSLPTSLSNYPAMRLDSTGASLYDQINSRAQSCVPDHWLTCNTLGQLAVRPDWMLLDLVDRPVDTAGTFTEDYWSDIRADYTRPPRVYVLNGNAVVCSTDWLIIGSEKTLPLAFCKAPGAAFGQGVSEVTTNEKLTISQAVLNNCEGHRYARLNARYGLFTIVEPTGDIQAFQPAHMLPVQVNISAATAAQRGLDFTTARGIVKSIDMRYNHTPQGTWVQPTVQWEREVVGLPAVTHIPAVPDNPDYEVPEPPSGTPDFGDPSLFFGDIQAYVCWDGAHIYRTWNLLDTSPVWHLIDTGISGSIFDCQYVYVDADTTGAWLMTSTGIWWCGDIQAPIVSWESQLTISFVQAAEEVPAFGAVTFQTMFHVWNQPGHLCVATGPDDHRQDNWDYLHAFFWVTEDFGETWTHVDMNQFTETDSGHTRCYSGASLYAMDAFRSEPIIFCVRVAPPVGLSDPKAVFVSLDGGFTWEKRVELNINGGNAEEINSILHPFPNIDDPSYIVLGAVGVSNRQDLYRSEDAWVTEVLELTTNGDPTGYGGLATHLRVNKRTFDETHVIAWFVQAANPHLVDLLESFDKGESWTLVWASGLDETNILGTPYGIVTTSPFGTPNGWPPDVDQWVVIRNNSGGNEPRVQLTLDNFDTVLDKTGDILALVPSWTNGPGDGFALPKQGTNAEEPPDSDSHVRVRVALATALDTTSPAQISSTGVLEGDTVLLHFQANEDIAPLTVPTGFTLVPDGEITGTNNIRIYQKIATGSEPATYDFTFTGGNNVRLGLIALYPDGGGTLAIDASGNATSGTSVPTAPSVNTTVPFTFLSCFFSLAATGTPTAQTGMVKQYNSSSGRPQCITQATYSGVGPTGVRTLSAGTTGARAVTLAWKRVV